MSVEKSSRATVSPDMRKDANLLTNLDVLMIYHSFNIGFKGLDVHDFNLNLHASNMVYKI